MRLFIAVRPSDVQIAALEALQQSWRAQGIGGTYTNRANLHLTLAFIGEYPSPENVLSAMRSAEFSPFTLTLSGVGRFGDLWWAGMQTDLPAYVARLRAALAGRRIPFDEKRFQPHITLLRRANAAEIPAGSLPPLFCRAERVLLMRSDRTERGMIYTEIGAVDARRPES